MPGEALCRAKHPESVHLHILEWESVYARASTVLAMNNNQTQLMEALDTYEPRFRTPCGHDEDAVHVQATDSVVSFCVRCERASETRTAA